MKTTTKSALLLSFVSLSVSVGIWAKTSERSFLPAKYETLSASEKETLLWERGIVESDYQGSLPALKSVNPIKLAFGSLRSKLEDVADEKSSSYEKSLHAHGVVAKVRFESTGDHPYTGLFEGADHGLIRLSVTSDPKKSTFAPGLALKLFRNGMSSQNVSALYKLSGQKDNHDFFANELSNVVPVEFDPQSLFSTSIFRRVSRYPTQISVKDFGNYTQEGVKVASPRSPRQIYFVPVEKQGESAGGVDFREPLLAIGEGTVLYDVYATDEHSVELKKQDTGRRERAIKIGRIVTTSHFIASSYGDSRLFFKHNAMDKD